MKDIKQSPNDCIRIIREKQYEHGKKINKEAVIDMTIFAICVIVLAVGYFLSKSIKEKIWFVNVLIGSRVILSCTMIYVIYRLIHIIPQKVRLKQLLAKDRSGYLESEFTRSDMLIIYEMLKNHRNKHIKILVLLLVVGIVLVVLLIKEFESGMNNPTVVLPLWGSWGVAMGSIVLKTQIIDKFCLISSLKYLDYRGNLIYISEIFNNEYEVIKNTWFSEKMIYLPGVFVIAFKDVKKVHDAPGNDVFIERKDGKRYRVGMKSAIKERANRYRKEIVKEIEKSTDMWVCKKCHIINSKKSVFCKNCGEYR